MAEANLVNKEVQQPKPDVVVPFSIPDSLLAKAKAAEGKDLGIPNPLPEMLQKVDAGKTERTAVLRDAGSTVFQQLMKPRTDSPENPEQIHQENQ